MLPKKSIIMMSILLPILIAGCALPVRDTGAKKEREIVTEAQVTAFKSQKQKMMVDIYIPIKEQYATSKHTESLQNLLGAGEHAKPECLQCHSTEYFLAPADQKPGLQDVTLAITCAACHVLTQSEFKLRLDPLETCTACHNATKEIIPGEVVHHPQKEMFLGYGAIGVPVTPDSKYKAGLTCIECHMPNEAHTFVGKTPAEAIKEHTESICVMCHADQSEEQFALEVDEIQSQIRKGIEQMTKGLEASKARIDQNRGQGLNVDQAQEVYNIVYTNISFVQADGTLGIHNFEYAKKILEYTKNRNQELEGLLK